MAAGRVGRTQGSSPALGSRQPTNCTNFCGADSWPLSPRCCNIAPQIPSRSFCGDVSLPGWPGAVCLPTSMLSLLTTKIPFEVKLQTRNCPEKLQHSARLCLSNRCFGSCSCRGLLHQRKVKESRFTSNPAVTTGVSCSVGRRRCPMRALSYVIAVVAVLTGPSLAGSAASDLPGAGTFSYNGSPLPSPAPEVAATVGQ
jgi:hypothetical protein